MNQEKLDELLGMSDYALLMALLHFAGTHNTLLTSSEHLQIMAKCDGYGELPAEQLVKDSLSWDWSHVRDSSEGAINRAASLAQKILRQRYVTPENSNYLPVD